MKPRRFTSKIQARCVGQGRPVGFILTGVVSDYRAVPALLDMPIPKPKRCLPTRDMTGMPCVKTCCGAELRRSSRQERTAGASSLRLQALPRSQPRRTLVQPSQAIPPYCRTVRQNRIVLSRLPLARRCQALANQLCQQDLVSALVAACMQCAAGTWRVVATHNSRRPNLSVVYVSDLLRSKAIARLRCEAQSLEFDFVWPGWLRCGFGDFRL